MKFCSGDCRRRWYKENPKPVAPKGQAGICPICNNEFEKIKGHQKFCSPSCYTQAWKLNPEANNERSKKRRLEQPEWYREKEPQYYRNYRTGQIEKRPWRYVFQSRRLDARNKGLDFDLTDEWCAGHWTGRCALTKIPFEKNPAGISGPHPLCASLDRVDPSKGYTQDNCRFILFACNGMKGSGSDEIMYRIAAALIENKP